MNKDLCRGHLKMDPCQAISWSRKPQPLPKLLNLQIEYAIMYLTVKINQISGLPIPKVWVSKLGLWSH